MSEKLAEIQKGNFSIAELAKATAARIKEVAEKDRLIVAAREIYNRLYPCDEDSAEMIGEFARATAYSFSKFYKTPDDWTETTFGPNMSMTVQDLREYIVKKFQPYDDELKRITDEAPTCERFSRVCGLLTRIADTTIADGSLICLFSKTYVKAHELLLINPTVKKQYCTHEEQKMMLDAFDAYCDKFMALFSSLGFPSSKRIPFLDKFPLWLEGREGRGRLFDGDVDHAVFNPVVIRGIVSRISLFSGLASKEDPDDCFRLVKNAFAEKRLYVESLSQVKIIAQAQKNLFSAHEEMERASLRIGMLKACLEGSLAEGWSKLLREEKELREELRQGNFASVADREACEQNLENVLKTKCVVINNEEKTGWKCEDILRGKVEVEKGRFVEIPQLKAAGGLDVFADATPVKHNETITDSSAEKPDSGRVIEDSCGECPQNSEDAVNAAASENTRGGEARFKEELCGGRFIGRSGSMRIAVKGGSILWQTVKRSGPLCCELSAGPAIRLMEKLLENSIQGIDSGTKPKCLYITGYLKKAFLRAVQRNEEDDVGKLFLEEVVKVAEKEERIKCDDVDDRIGEIYLDPILEDQTTKPIRVNFVYSVTLNREFAARWIPMGK